MTPSSPCALAASNIATPSPWIDALRTNGPPGTRISSRHAWRSCKGRSTHDTPSTARTSKTTYWTGLRFTARATAFASRACIRCCSRWKDGLPVSSRATISPSRTALRASTRSHTDSNSGYAGEMSLLLRLISVVEPSPPVPGRTTVAIARTPSHLISNTQSGSSKPCEPPSVASIGAMDGGGGGTSLMSATSSSSARTTIHCEGSSRPVRNRWYSPWCRRPLSRNVTLRSVHSSRS